MTVRTLVVGTGVMGLNHLRVLSQSTKAEVAGIVESDAGRAKAASEKFRVPSFPSIDEAVSQANAAAAVIATPTMAHHSLALKTLGAGLHTLVEKPLADTAEKAAELVEVAHKKKVTLAVGHVERHNPAFEFARRLIAKQSEGRILSITAQRVSPLPPRIQDVGVIVDLGSHEVDAICALGQSPVVSVSAATNLGHNSGNHETSAFVTLRMGDGSLASIETSWISPIKIRRLDVTTEKHLTQVDYMAQKVRQVRSKFGPIEPTNMFETMVEYDTQEFSLQRREPLQLEHEDFVGAIQERRRPAVSGEDGLRVVQIMEAALESARLGRAVRGKW